MEIENLRDITAAVLAGGLGTRLRPVVSDRPKVLAEVQGKPFLTYLLDQLVAAGIRDAVVCTGYLGGQVRNYFGYAYGDLRLTYSQEVSALGTAGALRAALPLLRSDTILAMNGDSFCDANLGAFWSWHSDRKAEASLVLAEALDTSPYGRVLTRADGRVLSFEEKADCAGPGWINAGIYLFNHSMIEDIPATEGASLERNVFPAWIGRSLYGYRSPCGVLDIGTPEGYGMAQRFFPEWSLITARSSSESASEVRVQKGR